MSSIFAAILVSTFAIHPTFAADPSAPDYKMSKAVALGAPDRWDSVVFDPSSQRVYVAHGDRVTVVDGVNGNVVGSIGTFPGGTHGVAISAANHRGYTDDGRAGTANAFDTGTLATEGAITADADADGIVTDPVTGHVYVINGDPGSVTVIDPKTNQAIAKIEAGAKLEFAVAGKGKIYVNGEAKKEIVRIDTATNKIDAHWPMPACTSPHGIALDETAHRLFSTCANAVMSIMDSENGTVIATLPIGRGSDGAAFDPQRKLAISPNGADGTISVIREVDAKTFVPVATIKTAVTGRTIDIDPKSGRLFIAAADAQPGDNGRPRAVPGTLKLLFFDPVP